MTHSVRSRILIRIVLYVIVLTKRFFFFFSRFWRYCTAPIRTIIHIYIYINDMYFYLFSFFFFNINIRDVSSLKNIYPSFDTVHLVRIFEIISCTVGTLLDESNRNA